jgi:hypothetical protein
MTKPAIQGSSGFDMARSTTTFQKGQSGNPKGRPPKSRALTTLLEKAGKKKMLPKPGEKAIPLNQYFAEKVWEGLTTGMIQFEGWMIPLYPNDYIALAKLVLGQIDGPPPAAVDVTSAGNPVQIAMVEIIKAPADAE